MEPSPLLLIGLACIIGAIVGGGLKLMHIEIPALASVRRQVLLGVVGVAVVVASFVLNGDDTPGPTPTGPGDGPAEPTQPEANDDGPGFPFPDETVLELSPTSGPPGTTVTLSGTGFSPGERVRIRFHTTEIASTRADDDGAFSAVTGRVPEDWPFTGQFDIVASGESSLRSTREPFEVE